MLDFIDEMAGKLRKGAIENYKIMWTTHRVNYDYWIGQMKEYLTARLAYLDNQYNGLDIPPYRSGNYNMGTFYLGSEHR